MSSQKRKVFIEGGVDCPKPKLGEDKGTNTCCAAGNIGRRDIVPTKISMRQDGDFCDARSWNTPTSGVLIQEQAVLPSSNYGYKFTGSNSWLNKWKQFSWQGEGENKTTASKNWLTMR